MTDKKAVEEMSVEDAEQLQREYILGDADYKLPNGQTKGEFLAAQRKKEAKEAAEAREREAESLRSQAAASPEKVRVRFKAGQLLVHPLATEPQEEVGDSKNDAASSKEAAKTKAEKK